MLSYFFLQQLSGRKFDSKKFYSAAGSTLGPLKFDSKTMNIDKIKNELLFTKVIRKEERYPSMDSLLEKARKIFLYQKREPFDGSDTSISIYQALAFKINYYKNLIAVCNDLNKQRFTGNFFELNDRYYLNFFKTQIQEARKSMRKLRPYVLEYTRNMKQEARDRLKQNSELGKYFGKWF